MRRLLLGAGVGVASATAVIAVTGTARPAAAADDAVRFEASRVPAAEGDTRVTLRVVRNATVALSEARVDFATEDYDATAGSDYIATNGTVVLGVGQTAAVIDVVLVDDRASEATERFHVVLTDPQYPGRLLDRTWVDVSDDDQWRDPPLATSNNRPAQGAQNTPGSGAGGGSAVTTPARPATRSAARSAGTGSAADARRSNRSTPFKLYRPAPAQPVTSEPASASPVAALGLVAAVALASVSARLWHHWRTTDDERD